MQKKPAKRSSLFLLELLLSILVFSIVSAWCVRLFAAAHVIAKETRELDKAHYQAGSYAEVFLAAQDFEAFLCREGAKEEKVGVGKLYRICYDKDWNICDGEGAFCFEVRLITEDSFEKGVFTYLKTQGREVIYELQAERYIGGEEKL